MFINILWNWTVQVIYTTNYDHMLEEYYKLKKGKLHKVCKVKSL